MRLYDTNHAVDAFNRKIPQGGRELLANDLITGYSNNDQLTSARSKLHRMSTMKTAGLPCSHMLSIGQPYMFTSNSDNEDGLVNRALGVLRYVQDELTGDNQ